MNTLLWALVLWFSTCTGPLSAQSRIFMSVGEGSSAVLPCDWRNKSINPSNQSLYIEWRTFSETVFERLGEEHYEGEGYEGRVDVPEDKLKKGNCSLVLKEVKAEDAGVYESYLLVNRVKRALSSKRVFIQSVELSVFESSEMILEKVPAAQQNISLRRAAPRQVFNIRRLASRNAGIIIVPSNIITSTILSNILLYIN
ncbi:hypothetical protein AMEX_G4274 [Astyanax mexicanus]|uniref:Ig-like domain-containing protein n=1 Tax=Astyanax mexicanus TaxID=7994 RepID=A0A8T2MAK3_ASTMX|nr:hypothetical protein AMEX_G4274 [Astyanax mexicanus]